MKIISVVHSIPQRNVQQGTHSLFRFVGNSTNNITFIIKNYNEETIQGSFKMFYMELPDENCHVARQKPV